MARSNPSSSVGLHKTGFSARCIRQLEALAKDPPVGGVMPLPAAQYAAKRAREYAHVITGYMKAHIRAEQHGQLGAVVRADAPYSGFEEFGTRFRPPHPFLRPAIADAEREVPKLTAREVNAEIRRRVNSA